MWEPIAWFRVEWSVFFLFPFFPRSVFPFPFSKWEKRWSVARSLKVLWKVLNFAWVERFRHRESMIVIQFILWDKLNVTQTVFCGESNSVYAVYPLFEKLTWWKLTLNAGTQYARRMLYTLSYGSLVFFFSCFAQFGMGAIRTCIFVVLSILIALSCWWKDIFVVWNSWAVSFRGLSLLFISSLRKSSSCPFYSFS